MLRTRATEDAGRSSFRPSVEAGEVGAALFLAFLEAALDQREDDHQGGEEGDNAEAEEGHRLVSGGAGEADALVGESRGGGDQHQGQEGGERGGEALHGAEI